MPVSPSVTDASLMDTLPNPCAGNGFALLAEARLTTLCERGIRSNIVMVRIIARRVFLIDITSG